ncbi:MAG: DUF3563 family protein [Betaproteobacteria bacterium]
MNIDRSLFSALNAGTLMLADALSFNPRAGAGSNAALGEFAEHERTRATSAPTPRKHWLDVLDTWFWKQRQRARETYLAQSQDVFEVERRMRDLERDIGSRYY